MVQPMSGLTSACALSSGRTVMVGAGACSGGIRRRRVAGNPQAGRAQEYAGEPFQAEQSRVIALQPTESRVGCRALRFRSSSWP